MEWIPSEEEYNPEITKEQWIEFIQDENIFNENALITFACIQKAKIATCADMAEEFIETIVYEIWYKQKKPRLRRPVKYKLCKAKKKDHLILIVDFENIIAPGSFVEDIVFQVTDKMFKNKDYDFSLEWQEFLSKYEKSKAV